MLNPEIQTPPSPGPIARILARIVGADVETLARCPRHEQDTMCALAEITLFSAVYKCAVFTFIGLRLFAVPSQFSFVVPIVAAFIALFIMRLDASAIMSSSFKMSGIAELKRGGIDISGDLFARAKAFLLVALRMFLGFDFAQLTVTFLLLLVFGQDIQARNDSDNIRANAPIVAAETDRVDSDIQRQRDAIVAEKEASNKAAAEASALRRREDDLTSSEPRLQEARTEVAQFVSAKAKSEDELQEAETFALNEAAGIKGVANNSGQIGEGVRYRAASERVANARTRVAEIASALDAARGRLDDLAKQFTERNNAARQHIDEQLSALEKSVTDGKERLATLNEQLTQLVRGREDAIHTAVLQAPGYVPKATGLLIEIATLRRMADGNPEIAIVILLIEISSLGFEMAAVLAVTSFTPTSYTALLASGAFMRSVAIVEEMNRDLDRRAAQPQGSVTGLAFGIDSANDNHSGFHAPKTAPPFDGPSDDPPPPPKRPRGRPRKSPVV